MKKVLIITYYWPPAGGPGVQRVLKFVKYLPEFDWEPIILTVKDGEFPSMDKSLLEDIPKHIKVYKIKTFEPFNVYKKILGKKKDEKISTLALNKKENEKFFEKLFRWIRFNIFLPDARIGWKKYIIKEGLKIIQNENPDIIFSSSPPHSLQLGADRLAKKTLVKWIADFRDPWTEGFWLKNLKRSFLAKKIDKHFEQKVIKNCDGLTCVSEAMIDLFGSSAESKSEIIPNGYDEEDFKNIVQKSNSEKFRIVYTGSLRESQVPEIFFTAIKELITEKKIQISKIEISFWGTIHPTINNLINENNLSDVVKVNNYIPHTEMISKIINSEMLILLIPNTENNKGILTGKLFEYLRTKNYILGFGPIDGEAASILEKTQCGKMFEFSANPKETIFAQYENWGNNIANIVDSRQIKNYSRKELAKKLAEFFNINIGKNRNN